MVETLFYRPCYHIAFCLFVGALFIFSTLLADFKDPIQNRDRVPCPWADLYIAHIPSIVLLQFCERILNGIKLYKKVKFFFVKGLRFQLKTKLLSDGLTESLKGGQTDRVTDRQTRRERRKTDRQYTYV